MGRKPTGDDRTLNDALMLCRNAMTAAEMRMALSIVLPGRTKTSLWEMKELKLSTESTWIICASLVQLHLNQLSTGF